MSEMKNEDPTTGIFGLPERLSDIIVSLLDVGSLCNLCNTTKSYGERYKALLDSNATYLDSQYASSQKGPMTVAGSCHPDAKAIKAKANSITCRIRQGSSQRILTGSDSDITKAKWQLILPDGITACHLLIDHPRQNANIMAGYDDFGVMRVIEQFKDARNASYMSITTRTAAFDGFRWVLPRINQMGSCKTLVLDQPAESLLHQLTEQSYQPGPSYYDEGNDKVGKEESFPDHIAIITGHPNHSSTPESHRNFQYRYTQVEMYNQSTGQLECPSQLDVVCSNLAVMQAALTGTETKLSLVGAERWDMADMSWPERIHAAHVSEEMLQGFVNARIRSMTDRNEHDSANIGLPSREVRFLTFEQAQKQNLLPSQNNRHRIAEAEEDNRLNMTKTEPVVSERTPA